MKSKAKQLKIWHKEDLPDTRFKSIRERLERKINDNKKSRDNKVDINRYTTTSIKDVLDETSNAIR